MKIHRSFYIAGAILFVGIAAAGVVIVTAPKNGTVETTANSLIYTPNLGFLGDDKIYYQRDQVPVEVLTTEDNNIEWNDSKKISRVPITLIVNEDGTREVIIGDPIE